MKPPRIPDDLMSGAAARAAAATQNEILETVRNLRLVEPKVPRDSESGIGIEMRDPWDEDDDEVVRKGEPCRSRSSGSY
jgi:F-box and WD-40 domain protein 1/11